MKTGPRESRDFCLFLTPHKLNFELLIKKNSSTKECELGMREKLSRILLFLQSLLLSLVVLLYPFYTFGAETRESKTGILPL